MTDSFRLSISTGPCPDGTLQVPQRLERAVLDMTSSPSPDGTGPASTTFVVALAGDVDIARKSELTELVAQYQTSDAVDAELDVTAVEFMDSTGLAALVRLNRIAEDRHGVVRVVGPTRPVRKVLSLSGVAQLVEVVG